MEPYHSLIKNLYLHSGADSTALFETILSLEKAIGLEKALAILEGCCIEKRLAWLEKNLAGLQRTGDPLRDGCHAFYESYLGVSIPGDGEIVEQSGTRLVLRWWNPCPTLEACRKVGLDTRLVCRQAYHRPVQEFLQQVDPRLRFDRNYAALRPYQTYCEELITLV
jgi:hypothetical protein